MTQNEVKLTPEQEKYIELVLEPKIKNEKGLFAYGIAISWAYIAGQRQKGQDDEMFEEKGEQIRKKYGTLDKWLAEQIYGDKSKTAEIEKLKKEFATAKGRWNTQKHRTGFENFEKCQKYIKEADKNDYEKGKYGFETFANFYRWYAKEPKKCCYCDITQDELENLWDKKLNLISSKKFSKALHIERLDPNKPYCSKNCRFACAVCNNAKSDLISKDDFKECFVCGIKKFYNLLKSRLKK